MAEAEVVSPSLRCFPMKTRSLLVGLFAPLVLMIAHGSALAHVDAVEGCTPGYWKQSQHFDSWPAPYAPDTRLRDVFVTDPVTLVPDDTFLDALNYGGGPGVDGAIRILLRAAVAALLNSTAPDVDFPVSAGHVILTSIDRMQKGRHAILVRAEYFDELNNGPAGCPLN